MECRHMRTRLATFSCATLGLTIVLATQAVDAAFGSGGNMTTATFFDSGAAALTPGLASISSMQIPPN